MLMGEKIIWKLMGQSSAAQRVKPPRRGRRGVSLLEATLSLLIAVVVINQVVTLAQREAYARAVEKDVRSIRDLAEAGETLFLSQSVTLPLGTGVAVGFNQLATMGGFEEGRTTQSATGRALGLSLIRRSDNEVVILARAALRASERERVAQPRGGAGVDLVGYVSGLAPNNLRGPGLDYDLSWLTGAYAAFKPQPGDIVALKILRRDMSMLPYLHRVPTPLTPELNAMTADLDMGGADIIDAGQIAATDINATGRLAAQTLAGTTLINGDLGVAELSVSGALTVQGGASIGGEVLAPRVVVQTELRSQTISSTTATISGVVNGVSDITITGGLTAADVAAERVTADSVTAEDASIGRVQAALISSQRLNNLGLGEFEQITTGSCTGC